MITEAEALKSQFIHDWVEDNVIIFKLQYPNADDDVLRKVLVDIAKDYTTNHKAHLHNDYQDDTIIEADLLKFYDWYKTNRPIAAGNGTFFYNQQQKQSPIQHVIDGRIAARKKYQKIRDGYLGEDGDTSSYEYQYFEMMQMEAKVKINAIYGSFGAKTFQLYNIYTAACTTGTAQSLISTTAMAFEGFLNNSVKFKSLGEMMHLVANVVVKDKHTLPLTGLEMIYDASKVKDLYKNLFVEYRPEYDTVLDNTFRHRTPEELTRLYYCNNLFAFIDNEMIRRRIQRVFDISESFRDPNHPGENIIPDLQFIWDYCNEFVFYNHSYTEQINRLKHDQRSRVILIDTDSNVINIEPWINWCKEKIWITSTTSMNADDLQFCSVNTIAYLITKMARTLLDRYATDCNVLPEYHSRLNIKNEFYFNKVLLAKVKKRYIADIRGREGKFVNKLEVKGHDFKKAGVSSDIEEKLIDIIKETIIQPETVDVVNLMQRSVQLENEIRESICKGERKYLIRYNCKQAKAYAEPFSQGAYTGPVLWNALNPDNEILIPDKLDVVFINVPNEQTIDEKLGKDFPEWAEKLKNVVFHGGIKEFQTKGVKYLALPNGSEPIPDWVIPILDIERTVTRNIGTFYPVLKALTFVTVTAGDNEYMTNILEV